MENALESIGNRADYMEERISELEDRIMEVLQVGEERELRSKTMREFFENCLILFGRATSGCWLSQKEKRGGREQKVYLKK